jgi:hypothetical protein
LFGKLDGFIAYKLLVSSGGVASVRTALLQFNKKKATLAAQQQLTGIRIEDSILMCRLPSLEEDQWLYSR